MIDKIINCLIAVGAFIITSMIMNAWVHDSELSVAMYLIVVLLLWAVKKFIKEGPLWIIYNDPYDDEFAVDDDGEEF